MRIFLATLLLLTLATSSGAVVLTTATVDAPADWKGPARKAVQMLTEEVEKRTQVPLQIGSGANGARIRLSIAQGGPAEGYRLRTSGAGVEITGNDERGLLFGVGQLLRTASLSRGEFRIDDNIDIVTSPKYALRGHQLGYRPKTNSYDGWTAPMWEQYIRDLVVFGTNAIELLPPRTDDDADSPHFPMPQMRMMVEMSRIAAEYGIDVWIWYPAMDKDYSDPATVTSAVREWGEVFRKLPRIDHVMVPGGDPGHTQPKYLMPLLEKQAANLRQFHPKAGMWVSPQSFSSDWLAEFLQLMKAEPRWLTGVVHGPEVRVSIAELRAAIPKQYPIRNYPDITHSTHSQFVVADWDIAYAMTASREPINPRPSAMRDIFLHDQPHTTGFLAYSEGCNDDVNKIVWSALGWNPDASVETVLRDYARYFIGPQFTQGFADVLASLERNWRGPLAGNAEVELTLEKAKRLERAATPVQLLNWRFQQMLYRSYYDAYTRRRLLVERAAEQDALDALRLAPSATSEVALSNAAQKLLAGNSDVNANALRLRVFQLAEGLFQSIRMQLTVAEYKAIGRDRGATLDNIDIPLNNRSWLLKQFEAIHKLPTESERIIAIDKVINWTDPGPGGFYDDLGNVQLQPHLVRYVTYSQDPGFLKNPLMGFARSAWSLTGWRLSWIDDAESMFDAPVELAYTDLDPQASYKVRVIYGGELSRYRQIRLVANGTTELQPYTMIEKLTEPVELSIPKSATASGKLRLTWTKAAGLPGAGRGCQIAEVWLIKN